MDKIYEGVINITEESLQLTILDLVIVTLIS